MEKNNSYISIQGISRVVEEALREQIENIIGLSVLDTASSGASADLVITSVYDCTDYMVPKLCVTEGRRLRLGELLLKIHQMLRHPCLYVEKIPMGEATFLPKEKLFRNGDGKEVSLTDREVDILYYLAQNANQTVSREKLLKDVWNYQVGVDTHTLETHLYRIRQKLEDSLGILGLLETTESGYVLNSKGSK